MFEVKVLVFNVIFSFDRYKSNKVFHECVEQSIRGDDCNTNQFLQGGSYKLHFVLDTLMRLY